MRRRYAGGITYLWALLAVALMGGALAAVAQIWTTAAQREREAELLFIGEQFRRAIGSYYEASPGPVKQFPPALTDLLADARFPGVRRHLRRIYPDPMTQSGEWALVRGPGNGIVGVHSTSQVHPLRTHFTQGLEDFASAQAYSAWVFNYNPGARPVTDTKPAPGSTAIGPGGILETGGRSTVGSGGEVRASASPALVTDPPPKPSSTRESECMALQLGERAQCNSITRTRGLAEGRACLQAANAAFRSCVEGGGAMAR